MKAFKAYDIRGKWGIELNASSAYRIGNFIPEIFGVTKILIGRDIRLSSDEFFNALVKGINDAGADVCDAGLTTTSMIYWGTGKFDFDLSIMITASHNPSEYNGLKFSGKNVLPIGYDNGLNKLEKLVDSSINTVIRKKGSIKKFIFKDDYIKFLKNYRHDYSNLNIAIDCSNGMSALLVRGIFGDAPYYINEKMDGNFPGHEPNPLEPKNQEQIKNIVKEKGCDIGVIFDGDADRVMFIDENGKFVSPDLILALLGHYFFEEKKAKGRVVQDIRTSKAVVEYLKQFNVHVDTWKVGRAYGATKLKEVNGVYGGELAGHYYFRDFYYSDSPFIAAELVLYIVTKFKSQGLSMSQLINRISTYANTGEINFPIKEKLKAMNEIVNYFKQTGEKYKFTDIDGYRMDFDDWWFCIRPSNTEPYLRFLAEGKNKDILEEKTNMINEILSQYPS